MLALGSALFLVVSILFLSSMSFYLFGVDLGGVTSRESRLRTKERSFWVWLSVYSATYVAVVYLLYWVWHRDGSVNLLEWLLSPIPVLAMVWVGALVLWIQMRTDPKADPPEERNDA